MTPLWRHSDVTARPNGVSVRRRWRRAGYRLCFGPRTGGTPESPPGLPSTCGLGSTRLAARATGPVRGRDPEERRTHDSRQQGFRVIEFESVSKTFRDGTTAVDNLNLVVPSGRITVIVGPSGC